MRIAVISNMYPNEKHISYGVFVRNFCNILDDINIDYKLHVMLKADSFLEKLVRYIKFYLGTTIALMFEKYDLIYVHYASHSSLPVLWVQKLRRKTIYTNVHGSDVVPINKSQERMQKYTKKILYLSKKIIVPSEYFKQLVAKKYGINTKKIYVSPSGGVNNQIFFQESKKKYSEKLEIGFVSRITYKKGLDKLLKACSILDISYSLTVVGDGELKTEMKQLSTILGIEQNVSWVSTLKQEELRRVYNRINVFVFPTERVESLGLVGLEAMACGTPVIASDYAALSDYILNGKNGFKFQVGNTEDLKIKIEQFYYLDENEKNKMAECALKTASDYFLEKVTEGIRGILKDK